jgi:hypothetical protein
MVVDEDRPGALDDLGLPETYTVETAGGGRHAYLQYVEGVRNSESRLAEDVDVRGEGGYVIVPPSDGYSVLSQGPVAECPSWLVHRLTAGPDLEAVEGGEGSEEPTRSRFELPERIAEGSRNGVLFRYGCSLRAHGHNYESILQKLRGANAERCAPKLEDREIRKISGGASGHEKGNASTVPPEVVKTVAYLEESARHRRKKGLGGQSRWALYRALLDCAGRHGWIQDGGDVAVRVAVRQLSLDAGVARRTIHRNLDSMENSGLVYRLSQGDGATPGILVLRVPSNTELQGVTNHYHQGEAHEGEEAALPLYRLRHGSGRLGKTAGAVLEILVRESGEASVGFLAKELRVRAYDLRRRAVARLQNAGVVETGEGVVRLSSDWGHYLDRERTFSGEKLAERLQRQAYEREREAYARYLKGEPSQADYSYDPPLEDSPAPSTDSSLGRELSPLAPPGGAASNGDTLRRGCVGGGESAVRELVRQGMEESLAWAEILGDSWVMLE